MAKPKISAKSMGYTKVFVGLLFFLNPHLSFLDVFPDFFGCFFILAGLSPLLFLDERARDARRYAVYLALFSGARTLLSPVYFSSGDGGNTNMLLSFSFGVVGLLLEFAFVRDLFDLYGYLANRKESAVGIKYLDAAQSAMMLFVFVKNIGAMLPDMLTLFSSDASLEYNYNTARMTQNFAFVQGVAAAAVALVVLGFGIYTLIRLRKFFLTSARETAFLARLRTAVDEGGESRSLRLKFLCSGVLGLLTALSVFSFDYYLDYVSILPACLSFVFLFLIFYRLRGYVPVTRANYVFVFFGFLVTAVSYVYRVFYASLDAYVGENFHLQSFTVVLGIAQALFCLGAFVLGARRIERAVHKVSGIDLRAEVNVATVFALLSCGVNAYNYIMPKGGSVTDLMEFYVLLNLLVGLAFVFFTIRIGSAFHHEVEWKTL